MSAAVQADDSPTKKSGRGMLFGLVAAVALGGGGFYATWSGLLPVGTGGGHTATGHDAEPLGAIAFVPVPQLVISYGAGAGRHLRFSAEIEVDDAYRKDVELILPRILDVLNSYLRALELADLEDPAALVRLRAQMLRRVQVVAGDGRVRDILITEFVLN